MVFTEKKRRFVDALQSGLTGKAAAVAAGYSEKGASQAASRLMNDPDVIAALERKERVADAKAEAKESQKRVTAKGLAQLFDDPKDFLTELMNDESEEMRLRIDAAKTLMPYMHTRKGETGKKEERQKAADTATSRFAVPAAPARMH